MSRPIVSKAEFQELAEQRQRPCSIAEISLHSPSADQAWSLPVDLWIDQIASGQQLIEALVAEGFDIRVAFWAKPTEQGRWYLYLASSLANNDAKLAYRRVHDMFSRMPDLGIDSLEVKVVRSNDSLADAALALIKPRPPGGPYAASDPRYIRIMTRLGETTLSGLSMDAVYLYPSLPLN